MILIYLHSSTTAGTLCPSRHARYASSSSGVGSTTAALSFSVPLSFRLVYFRKSELNGTRSSLKKLLRPSASSVALFWLLRFFYSVPIRVNLDTNCSSASCSLKNSTSLTVNLLRNRRSNISDFLIHQRFLCQKCLCAVMIWNGT